MKGDFWDFIAKLGSCEFHPLICGEDISFISETKSANLIGYRTSFVDSNVCRDINFSVSINYPPKDR